MRDSVLNSSDYVIILLLSSLLAALLLDADGREKKVFPWHTKKKLYIAYTVLNFIMNYFKVTHKAKSVAMSFDLLLPHHRHIAQRA